MTAALNTKRDKESGSSRVDSTRVAVSRATSRERKASLGQFMTPIEIATFMASLLPPSDNKPARILDAGAGVGSLSSALLERQIGGDFDAPSIEAIAYEIDPLLVPHLNTTLAHYAHLDERISYEVRAMNFLKDGLLQLGAHAHTRFTHAILNPPYKKIGSQSEERELLREAGIETVNLYSGFVALALLLMERGGHLCAIIPRSFCNGPYYRPFRDLLLREASVKRIHLFGSRSDAFAEDEVLQENVIILLERQGIQGSVVLSSSRDAGFDDLKEWSLSADAIIRPGDPERMICLPTEGEAAGVLPDKFDRSLVEIGAQVSTGPVVDFRLKEHLRPAPVSGSVPLLYPAHFIDGRLCWPRDGIKKPNAIVDNEETRKWLFPRGNYVIVRRFSSKEERRRVVATLVREDELPEPFVGFENHVNVFHVAKRGLDLELATGLTVYLNSTLVDVHFRTFSGHTQVNATDLKGLPYPTVADLVAMGRGIPEGSMTQAEIDERVGAVI